MRGDPATSPTQQVACASTHRHHFPGPGGVLEHPVAVAALGQQLFSLFFYGSSMYEPHRKALATPFLPPSGDADSPRL